MKTGIAFFDFDGTITTRDSLLEFIKFARGSARFYCGMLLLAPYLMCMKLKIVGNQTAKEKVLAHFFRHTDAQAFKRLCNRFSTDILPHLIRRGALGEIERLKQMGYVVVIVSASPEDWIRPWALGKQLEVIGSQLEIKGGRITGRLTGKNCHGAEKVRRIREKYDLGNYDEVFAYGDSAGDRPMLKLAHTSHYRPFRH